MTKENSFDTCDSSHMMSKDYRYKYVSEKVI